MKYKNYIFDFDGTIINSQKDVFLCFEKAFDKVNYKIDKTRLNPDVIGPPLRDIVRLIAPELEDENLIDEICDVFRNVYDNDANDNTYIYDGIKNFLQYLKENGKRIFMATYKPMEPTLMLCDKLGIINYFEDIYGIDKFGYHIDKETMIKDIIKKYRLHKTKTVMIGDAPSDMVAARDAGIDRIGCLWGYGSDKTMLKFYANTVIEKVSDLLKEDVNI